MDNDDRNTYNPSSRRRGDARPQRSRSRPRDERRRTEPTRGEIQTGRTRDGDYSPPRTPQLHHRDRPLPIGEDEDYINQRVRNLGLHTDPDGNTYVPAIMSAANVATKGRPTTGTEEGSHRNVIKTPQDCLRVVPRPRRNSSRERSIVPLVRGTAPPTRRPSAQSVGRLLAAPSENTYLPCQERIMDGQFSDEPSRYDQDDSRPDDSQRRSDRRTSSRTPDRGTYNTHPELSRLEKKSRPDSQYRGHYRATSRRRESYDQGTAMTERARELDTRPHDSRRRSRRPTQTDTTRLRSPSTETRRPRREAQTGTSKAKKPGEEYRASATSQRRGSDEVFVLQSGESTASEDDSDRSRRVFLPQGLRTNGSAKVRRVGVCRYLIGLAMPESTGYEVLLARRNEVNGHGDA